MANTIIGFDSVGLVMIFQQKPLRDYRAKKIGREEDAIKSVVKDTIPTSSVLNDRNMATMQIIITNFNL